MVRVPERVDITNTVLSGQGTYEFANGNIYRGEFVGGMFDGKGTYRWVNLPLSCSPPPPPCLSWACSLLYLDKMQTSTLCVNRRILPYMKVSGTRTRCTALVIHRGTIFIYNIYLCLQQFTSYTDFHPTSTRLGLDIGTYTTKNGDRYHGAQTTNTHTD